MGSTLLGGAMGTPERENDTTTNKGGGGKEGGTKKHGITKKEGEEGGNKKRAKKAIEGSGEGMEIEGTGKLSVPLAPSGTMKEAGAFNDMTVNTAREEGCGYGLTPPPPPPQAPEAAGAGGGATSRRREITLEYTPRST